MGPCLRTVFWEPYSQAVPKNLTLLGNLFRKPLPGNLLGNVFPQQRKLGVFSHPKNKISKHISQEQVRKQGCQERFPTQVPKNRFPGKVPSKGSRNSCQARFPGTGSQSRFPGTGFQEKVAKKVSKNRFASKGFQARFLGTGFQASASVGLDHDRGSGESVDAASVKNRSLSRGFPVWCRGSTIVGTFPNSTGL